MIKKYLAVLAVVFMTGTAFASPMFFDDNPRYIQVGRDDTTESYVDMQSIQSIRYDPPFYIIQATVITHDFTNNTTTGYENKFFYNFKAQTVKAQTIATMPYDANGLPAQAFMLPNPSVNLCAQYSVNGKAADKAFFNCYNMTFYHTFTTAQKQRPAAAPAAALPKAVLLPTQQRT